MHQNPIPKSLVRAGLAALAIVIAVPALAVDIPDSPDGTVNAVMKALADRHPEVVWQALPPTYQKDITELTHTFATKMDPKVWDAAFGLGRKTAALLRDKKAYILGSSFMKSAGNDTQRIEKNWDTMVTMLDSFFSSEISKLDSLQKMDWEKFLSTTVRTMIDSAAQGSAKRGDDAFDREFTQKLRDTKVEVVSRDGDRAILRISAPGEEPEQQELVRVEGRWIPADMAGEWSQNVTEAKQKLAAMTDEEVQQSSMQAMMMIGMVDGMLTQLQAVQSTEQFEQALQGLIGPFLGGMMGGKAGPMVDEPRPEANAD